MHSWCIHARRYRRSSGSQTAHCHKGKSWKHESLEPQQCLSAQLQAFWGPRSSCSNGDRHRDFLIPASQYQNGNCKGAFWPWSHIVLEIFPEAQPSSDFVSTPFSVLNPFLLKILAKFLCLVLNSDTEPNDEYLIELLRHEVTVSVKALYKE